MKASYFFFLLTNFNAWNKFRITKSKGKNCYGKGENIWEAHTPYGVALYNMWGTHATHQREKHSLKGWAKTLDRHFSKEAIRGASEYTKRGITIRETAVTSTVTCPLPPGRMAVTRKSEGNRWWWGREEKGALGCCRWEWRLLSLPRKPECRDLKRLKLELPTLWFSNFASGCVTRSVQKVSSHVAWKIEEFIEEDTRNTVHRTMTP